MSNGIIRAKDRYKEFTNLKKGEIKRKCLSTGFECLDEHIKFAKKYVAIWTGYPSSGKSEFVDACLVNMAIGHDWKTQFYSPENFPTEMHMAKLAEKYIGKNITKFTNEDFENALEFMEKHFTWVYPDDPELNELLKLAAIENQANGIDSVVYDPWNSITHKRVGMVHEFLSEELTKITRFARTQDVLFNIVAHPKIPVVGRDGSIPVPDLYSISDGAMWRNKADYGIICHRPDHNKDMLEVHIQKIKYKWMGKIGIFQFDYDNPSGRFKAPEDKFFLLPHESEPAF